MTKERAELTGKDLVALVEKMNAASAKWDVAFDLGKNTLNDLIDAFGRMKMAKTITEREARAKDTENAIRRVGALWGKFTVSTTMLALNIWAARSVIERFGAACDAEMRRREERRPLRRFRAWIGWIFRGRKERK